MPDLLKGKACFVKEISVTSSMFDEEKEVLFYDKVRNIFVMNNHRLAFYCWQKHFNNLKHGKIVIVHIDFHPDACPINKGDMDDFKKHTDLRWLTKKYLLWDNFISAFALRNNNDVKVISLVQENELGNAFDQEYEKFEVKNFSNEQEESFFKYLKNENIDILDIDLDYFLDVNLAQNLFTPWSKERINDFFLKLFSVIKSPKIITIATSPSCTGTIFENNLSIKSSSIYKIVKNNLHKFLV
jgi:hypothetical protein